MKREAPLVLAPMANGGEDIKIQKRALLGLVAG